MKTAPTNRPIRAVPDPPRSAYHAPELRFHTDLTNADNGLALRVRDTKRRLRTIVICIPPPGTNPRELTNTVVYHALDTMLRLTQMPIDADDETVSEAILEALDAGTDETAGARW